jgi:hypothetical protein
LAVPVESGRGEALGVLYLGHPEPHAFDERDERLVVGIAGQAAVALDNARLYQAQRDARAVAERAQRRLAVLAEAGRWLLSSLDVDETLAGLARTVVPRVADGCVVEVVDDDGSLRRVAAVGAEAGATASVPLPGRTEVYGTITFVTTAPRTVEPEDVALLEELGARAGVAVENARLFRQHRDAALTLQRSLLPESLPEVAGLTFASRYLPGGAGLEVGGDFYDVLLLPGGDVGVVLGDVVGRGIEAASLMGQLRNGLRAYALDGHEPGDALTRLDRLVQATSRVPLVTLLYGRLDAATGELRLANAGHPPPLVVGPDGTARFLAPAEAPPVGVVVGASYPEQSAVLAPGETLVLYTDGLVEQRDVGLETGMATLLELARSTPVADLDAFCDEVVRAALGDMTAHDDVALLAVRRDRG